MAYSMCTWPCSYQEICFEGGPDWLAACVLVPGTGGGCGNAC